MSFDIAVVFGLLILSLVLFAWERFSFDITALMVLAVLLLTGLVTPREGLSGFGNPAVVTIAAMFVLSEGLRRTGFLDLLGEAIARAGRGGFWPTVLILMAAIGAVSGFINNTAAVAIFIPVVLGIAADLGVSPSKLLIPVSFASMFGGVCTLIGTSTNLLVADIAREAGLEGFSMFSFAPVGLAFFLLGFAYLALFGVRMLPERRASEDLTANYGMGDYITDVAVGPESPLVGSTLAESRLTSDLDVDVLEVFRGGTEPGGEGRSLEIAGSDTDVPVRRDLPDPGRDGRAQGPRVRLRSGDVLRVRGGAEGIERLLDFEGLTLKPPVEWVDADLQRGHDTLVEAVVAPDSPIVRQPVRTVDFARRFGGVVLAIRRHGELERNHLGDVRLSGGDSVLLLMDPERANEVERDESFVVVSGLGRRQRRDRMGVALAVLVGVVSAAAVGLVPIAVSAVTGALLLVVTGCLTTSEAYDAVNWKVIVLLAGVLPLGTAMERSGAAALLADGVLALGGSLGPHAVLAGFLFLTMALTAVVTNNATAVLLAPVAISAASELGVNAMPLLMAVTYAASLSLVTPIGYQTNTLVYGPGGYRFTDYTRVGAPLNLAFLVLGTLLIPLVFPF